MAKVLVVGGAGYVGSAACAWLMDRGHEVWVLDDLSTGRRDLVLTPRFVKGKAGDLAVVGPLLARERFDCVMHFAAKSLVGESVRLPDVYRENNVEQTERLLGAMLDAGTRCLVFSSTAAVFGDPGTETIDEDAPKRPINPYGETKLAAERLMERLAAERGLRAIALRYFNAAGAEPGLRVGECHEPETHLIPNILKAAVEGRAVQVFGQDYPTSDGTCVRDYVHVTDLAAAHESAMRRLLAGSGGVFEAYNLGSGAGFSVTQIVAACARVIGKQIAVDSKPRRPGDPPRLVASSERARAVLGFEPGDDSLDRIVASAWAWERKRREPGRAVFLDRDGTINEDPGYLSQPSQLVLLPGVGEALAVLRRAGYRLVVVSNQSGVGRGLIAPDMLPRIHDRLDELLSAYGAWIDRYELCIHRPEEDCDCRKPKAKLLVDGARALGVDLDRSYMVGDKLSDLGAGRAAGCAASVLVRTGEGEGAERELKPGQADFVADSLREAADWIAARGT
jgi:UDP-glucose 4-epimerase